MMKPNSDEFDYFYYQSLIKTIQNQQNSFQNLPPFGKIKNFTKMFFSEPRFFKKT